MSLSVTVLTNPTAGRGTAPASSARAVARLRERGVEVAAIEGRTPGDALELTKRAVRSGTDVVVAVGGDGLVNLALQALARTPTPLAVIPAGTGNDLARVLGVPAADPEAAADLVVSGAQRSMDLGSVGDRWFATVLCSGFDSAVTERANRLRWPTGRRRYDVATVLELIRLRPIPYRVQFDDAEILLDATLVAVGNSDCYGGGMPICPGARVNDGFLDVTVVRAVRRSRLLRLSPTVRAGKHIELSDVQTFRCRRVTLDAPAVISYADGERMASLPVTAESVPGALQVIVGPDSYLY